MESNSPEQESSIFFVSCQPARAPNSRVHQIEAIAGMNDITEKIISLRTARGEGFVRCSAATLERIQAGDLPKGNFFDTARAAGLLGAKQTQHLLPHCHPVPIEGCDIDYEVVPPDPEGDGRGAVRILVSARSVGRTGIEMEVLTAISVTALCMYDMLKPVEAARALAIEGVRLLEKTGGRSQARAERAQHESIDTSDTSDASDSIRAAVLVFSDRGARGEREYQSGPAARDVLAAHDVPVADLQIVPADATAIQGAVRGWVDQGIPFIFTSGGTGIAPRDGTPEALREIIEREVPGIAEAMRRFGQDRTALAMFSRQLAGTVGGSLIVTLPGSPRGVREGLQAILPGALHARAMLAGGDHG